MSVVIKMDMPRSCHECARKCGLINHCEAFISEDWGKHDVSCERATDCPILCELPEKHGDLIDRDELKKHKEYNLERHENVVSVACIDWMMPLVEKENEHENSI